MGLTKQAYERCCEVACELVEDPDFQRAVDLVAQALQLAPSLDHQALELLRAATAFAEPEPEGVPA